MIPHNGQYSYATPHIHTVNLTLRLPGFEPTPIGALLQFVFVLAEDKKKQNQRYISLKPRHNRHKHQVIRIQDPTRVCPTPCLCDG
jgi:hypothetical protein